ncbi:hypothetical protein ACNOYE_29025 [Nannocystaceae bacterium ST9]
MKGLSILLKLDAKLAVRHRLLAVALVVATLFGLLIRLLVPAEIDHAMVDPSAGLELPAATLLDVGAHKPPLDQQMVFLLFALDLCLLGLMFGAVMVLEDRRTEAIRFYRISPGGTVAYVASELIVNLGLSLLNFAIVVGVAAPAMLGRPALLGLNMLLCAGMTLVGIGLAPLTRGIAQFFFPLLVIGLVSALPMYLIWSPAQGLEWTWWLPTWHALFGSEAIVLGEGRAAAQTLAREAGIYALVFFVGALAFALVSVDRRLLREVH